MKGEKEADGTLIYQPHRCKITGKYCQKSSCVLADKEEGVETPDR